MDKILEIAFSGFWSFVGMILLIIIILYFTETLLVKIWESWVKLLTSATNNTPHTPIKHEPLWHTETTTTITPDISRVTRFEVIDHSLPYPEAGRAYSKHKIEKLELSIQDEGRTLKVFISKKDN